MPQFASRAGLKLDAALEAFHLDVSGLTFADLGCNAGGFVDCLLQRGAARVYAIDTGYGMLDWKLRKDPRVVVMERTNAMHAALPEPVSLVTIDVAWTKQKHVLPAGRRMMSDNGDVISLIKPHYEAHPAWLTRGVLPLERVQEVVEAVKAVVRFAGLEVIGTMVSPILGAKGNTEILAHLRPIRPPK